MRTETADVIVVGAGVQGASLAFHLARRGGDFAPYTTERLTRVGD